MHIAPTLLAPYKQQNGFTLVELAIALVIIGLLVGGVLQGQELIRQAQIRKQIQALGDFDLAFNTFRTKYDAPPGDVRNPERFFPECYYANPGIIISGDGNGLIDDDYDAESGMGGDRREYHCVMLHLKNAGMWDPPRIKATDTYDGSGNNPPADVDYSSAALSVPFFIWKYGDIRGMEATPGMLVSYTATADVLHACSGVAKMSARPWCPQALAGRNVMRISGAALLALAAKDGDVWEGYFSPEIMSIIDGKMDDGKPYTGKIRGHSLFGGGEESRCFTFTSEGDGGPSTRRSEYYKTSPRVCALEYVF